MQKITCNNCSELNNPRARYCSSCGHELPQPVIEPAEEIPQKPHHSNRKLIFTLAGVVIGLLVVLGGGYAVKKFVTSATVIDAAMLQLTSETNKHCPMMIDQETRFDNVTALPGKILQYNYTMVHVDADSIDSDGFLNYIEPRIINNVRTNPDMQFQRTSRMTLNFSYSDKDGEFICKISVSPDKYE